MNIYGVDTAELARLRAAVRRPTRRDTLIDTLEKNVELTVSEAARLMNCKHEAAHRALLRLRKLGITQCRLVPRPTGGTQGMWGLR